MATVAEYVDVFTGALVDIATRLGSDPSSADTQTRAIATGQLALLATVVQVLVDKGVVTDGELVTAFNTAVAQVWGPLPTPPPPSP